MPLSHCDSLDFDKTPNAYRNNLSFSLRLLFHSHKLSYNVQILVTQMLNRPFPNANLHADERT